MALPARPLPPEVLDQPHLRPHSDTIVTFPQRTQPPLALRRVYRLTQGMTLLLSGTTLLFYAGTVWGEMHWQKQYSYYLQLQQQRLELTTMTATLEHHLVESGGRGVVQTPAQTLFIAPAPPRASRPVPLPQVRSWPMGGY